MRVNSVPSFKLLADIFLGEARCIAFLFAEAAIHKERQCSCGDMLEYNSTRKGFRCGRKSCHRKEISVFKGTFFFKHHLKCNEIMHIAHLWLIGACVRMISQYTGHDEETVADFLQYFRELIEASLDEEDTFIGGPNIVVEIDETKVGKRKHHRGHPVDGVWVLGGGWC